MEMANFTTLSTPTFQRTSFYFLKLSNYPFNYRSSFHHWRCTKPSTKFRRKPFRIRCSNSSSLKVCGNSTDIWADHHTVEVIGIGSRVGSVLDFCLQSPSSSHLRFWNVVTKESFRGQLHQRFLEKDSCPNIAEAPLNLQSSLKAVVLVGSAGYGDDYLTATDIIRTVRSGGGLVVAVILKPFSFEGQRRQDEVKILVDKLQDYVNFCVDIDIDTLLKMDLVTLDEALKTAYRAVSSVIDAVSVLISVLESYKEGRVGFGVGHSVEASIVQAVYDCPFLSIGLKDLNGVVICILSSSSAIGDSNAYNFLSTFREATECTKEVILSIVHNPDMKPNLIETTVITVCASERKSLQNGSILSRLADSIPFVFNFFRRHDIQSDNPKKSNPSENILPPMLTNFVVENEVPDMVPVDGTTESFETYSGKEMLLDENCGQKECYDGRTDRVGYLDADGNSSKYIELNVQGAEAYGRKPLVSRNLRPGYRISQEWHEEELNVSGADPVADNPRSFQLPVGVKLSDDLQDTSDRSNSGQPVEKITDEGVQVQASAVPSVSPLNGFTDVGFEAVTDFWNGASTLLKGKQLYLSKKQGVLSARAASMLESERDSKTRWSPVMEIRYRGGIYKGRCQGGLPEGRGRLTFLDGSVYDGMWRYGKRSGLGSLFFSNGDVFHGSWRDDLMHGKGWLYFHTGERWFTNFWKGRANGEGRFYSNSGEVFFGHFQDGWRHGRFLCVKIDGTRYAEIWNEGVLMSSEELDC